MVSSHYPYQLGVIINSTLLMSLEVVGQLDMVEHLMIALLC